MSKFIGRSAELSILEKVRSGDGLHTCAVYGRPRIGSSALARKFCEGKRSVIVSFTEGTVPEVLEAFRECLSEYGPEVPRIDYYREAFNRLASLCYDGTVVLLDNITYADSDGFRSALAEFIGNEIRGKDRMLVICGSPSNAVRSMLGDKRLKDLFPERIEVPPLSFPEARQFHQKMKDRDAYMCYLTVGGTPLYQQLMNKPDYASCVEKCFLGTYPRLCAESEILARRSSVPFAYCSAIISAVAKGCGRPIEIANSQKISRQLCGVYLKHMEEEGLLMRLRPMANAPKHPMMTVKDPLLAFYHTVIRNNPDVVLEDKPSFSDIEPEAGMFLELRFRKACYRYLCAKGYDVGGWWRKGEDSTAVNLAAEKEEGGKRIFLLCSCKFRPGKLDSGALDALADRAKGVEAENLRLAVFSASGFDGSATKAASKAGVLLVGPKELFS